MAKTPPKSKVKTTPKTSLKSKIVASAKHEREARARSEPIKELYERESIPALQKQFGIKNRFALPRLKYIKINVGIGSYVTAGKDHEDVVRNVATITGQKPLVIRTKKAISNFKLKIGMPTGVTVTLRGKRMYDFLTKLVHTVLPRIRDFRGISPKAFDGHGNYSLGMREHTVFPEITPEDVSKIHGIQIVIVTTAGSDEKGLALLKTLKFPFRTA